MSKYNLDGEEILIKDFLQNPDKYQVDKILLEEGGEISLDDLKQTEYTNNIGHFMTYVDYDGDDDEGRPIYLHYLWLLVDNTQN